jgi:hypothetical protein
MARTPANHQKALDFFGTGSVKNNVFSAPMLYNLGVGGKFRTWQVFVAIRQGDNYIDPSPYVDRAKLPRDAVGTLWTVSGQEGTPNPMRSAVTDIFEGKNLKGTNYTTPFTQALLEALSAFDKKVRHGHVPRKDLLLEDRPYTFEELEAMEDRGEAYWRVFPMKIHDINKNKRLEKLSFPVYVQPKIDGTHFLVVLVPPGNAILEDEEDGAARAPAPRIDGFSPTRDEYTSQPHVLAEAQRLLEPFPGLFLVGELWRRGLSLQEISGASRRAASSSRGVAERMFFNCFDCFRLEKPEWPVEERRALLERIFKRHMGLAKDAPLDQEALYADLFRYEILSSAENTESTANTSPEAGDSSAAAAATAVSTVASLANHADENGEDESNAGASSSSEPERWIRLVPHWEVADLAAAHALYERFIKDGLEGAVVRLQAAPYEFGVNKERRSSSTLKWKPRPDAEWPLIGFTEGVGKEKGAVVWICASNLGEEELSQRKSFAVTPNMDYASRQAIFQHLLESREKDETGPPEGGEFKRLYGAPFTVQYSILSKDKLPQQPKGLYFKNPKLNRRVLSWAAK